MLLTASTGLRLSKGDCLVVAMCRYLSFVQGIVDSDTLPLQVSRENLQQHAALKTIKKKLVRKALDMIRKLSDAETDFEAEDADSKLASFCHPASSCYLWSPTDREGTCCAGPQRGLPGIS